MLQVAGTTIGGDAADLLGIVVAPIYVPVLDAYFLQGALHNQSADWAPSLRAGHRPDDDTPTGEREVADGPDQMSSPYPGSRKQNDGV